ncbi:MAG: gamma-glutamyl-gamma-aminobutyrate hydrolase family protein [Sarcina sp.]
MNKKIIGIASNVITEDKKPFIGSKEIKLYEEYVQAIIDAGAVPIVIPTNTNKDVMKVQIDIVDGLLLTGGYDINPLRYNEEPSSKIQDVSMLRDECEFFLLEKADERKIPVLGICRGHQLINVFYGGTLYQDLSFKEGAYIKHVEDANPSIGFHSVDIIKGSILYEILGAQNKVNSYHHLGLKDVAKGFEVSAYAKDGIIEAIERKEPFTMGIQWHPEMMQKENEQMRNIFKCFIGKC